jgi:flagellar motility protein MotE (MotC chaperone)
LDLDRRRVDLESRSARLDDRAKELAEQEKALSVQLSELRELTGALRQARLENSKEESAKVEQLSKVYGSMNPPEAAALIEQLDIQIALPLLVRMPDKRMAQILALMKPEKAVQITRMLSSTKYDSSPLPKQSEKSNLK